MSSDESPNVPENADGPAAGRPTHRGRRQAVREKAQRVKVRQSRARVLRISSLIVGAVAIVAVIAVGVALALTSAVSKPQLQPASATDGGFSVGPVNGSAAAAPAAPTQTGEVQSTGASPSPTTAGRVQIRVYVDYLSPGAKQFQVANSSQLASWVNQGAATLTYHPVAMLTSKSNGTKYSLRAASAAACVASHDSAAFPAFNDALLKKQPAADSDGLSDVELSDLAASSGAKADAVRTCILNGDFSSWAKSATDRALEGLPDTKGLSLTAVPTVLVNGSVYIGNLEDPKEFAQFVLTLSSEAYYGTPTPNPTASPTAR